MFKERKMRNKTVHSLLTVTFLVFAGTGALSAQQQNAPPPSQFKLSSSAYSEGSQIPNQFTCADPNVSSPPLQWSNPPKNSASFAIVFHDTDAAPGKNSMDVTHWILWNIPENTTQLARGIKPETSPDGIVQGKNIRGTNGYQGPCPPPGASPHHYIFEIYALDSKLDLPAGSTRADLLKAMDGHVIGKATYVGLFGR
jgi:Raf kinase inhibitor-like YbhB/YbcL family protein